jgi:hypothetical protein
MPEIQLLPVKTGIELAHIIQVESWQCANPGLKISKSHNLFLFVNRIIYILKYINPIQSRCQVQRNKSFQKQQIIIAAPIGLRTALLYSGRDAPGSG